MRAGVLRLRIPSDVDHVFLVGLAVNGICSRILHTAEEVYQAELCVVEAVNNVIEHAYWGAIDHSVEIVVRVDEKELTFEVADMGRSMDWQGVLTASGTPPIDLRCEGGRGLSIMRSCMDMVSYQSTAGKNVLTLVKRLPEDDGASLGRSG
jgi:serine/threonine-protein kinase RsbW